MAGLNIELIPDPKDGGFTARLPDIPAYGEGETEEAAIADLKEALKTYIEAFGLEDALSRQRTGMKTRTSFCGRRLNVSAALWPFYCPREAG